MWLCVYWMVNHGFSSGVSINEESPIANSWLAYFTENPCITRGFAYDPVFSGTCVFSLVYKGHHYAFETADTPIPQQCQIPFSDPNGYIKIDHELILYLNELTRNILIILGKKPDMEHIEASVESWGYRQSSSKSWTTIPDDYPPSRKPPYVESGFHSCTAQSSFGLLRIIGPVLHSHSWFMIGWLDGSIAEKSHPVPPSY